ncbi:TolB family protein [Metabacillus fastidiosus]|uniref:TolB family protein n=1 Tax=Metabacillus fastidiosus TaxID=1458 RepID=UPI003D284647
MKKKNLIFLLLFLFILTAVLIVTGIFFSKTENEKQNGLSNQYDVSSQSKIAYVVYKEGKPQLFLYDEKQRNDTLAAEYDVNTIILDPTFTNDGSTLAYITSNKDKERELNSTVHFLDLQTKKITEVFTDTSVITEVEFKPDHSSLVYLRAGTYENYSPIAGKRPHDFDVYEFNLNKKSHKQITDLQHYSMESLNISSNGDRVYIQRSDDSDVKTAEDSFQVQQRIFEIPLDHPEKTAVISNPEREVDIYTFAITPAGNDLIFQSISNSEEGGTFKYELYKYNLDSKEEKQLTHLGEHVGDPLISADGETIYFMLDENFANGRPVHHLYKMDINGEQIREIILPNK